MLGYLSRILSESDASLRRRLIGVYALLIAANVLVWVWALAVLHETPVLLGTALLAYSFGLRHAVDADHIAAIDNVTRKLMQQGQRPVGVGLWFSLGHSAVIAALSVAVAFATSLTGRFESMKAVGGIISTSASALFLFTIAIVNILVLISVYRTFQAVKRGAPFVENDFDLLLNSRGFLSRIFRPLFKLVTKSWHMIAVGLLFGVGFDTATSASRPPRRRVAHHQSRRSWFSPPCSRQAGPAFAVRALVEGQPPGDAGLSARKRQIDSPCGWASPPLRSQDKAARARRQSRRRNPAAPWRRAAAGWRPGGRREKRMRFRRSIRHQ